MTIDRTATVPPGMSCVNAFIALWRESRPIGLGFLASTEPISSAAKVALLFTENTYFDWVAGRPIKTNFSKFPKLDVSIYESPEYFGPGAAQKALDKYSEIPSNERLDTNDSYEFKNLITLKDNPRELDTLKYEALRERLSFSY